MSEKKRDSVSQAFFNGWNDREAYGLLRKEQLYRRPWSRRVAWRLGWELANVLTNRPLRTTKGPFKAAEPRFKSTV